VQNCSTSENRLQAGSPQGNLNHKRCKVKKVNEQRKVHEQQMNNRLTESWQARPVTKTVVRLTSTKITSIHSIFYILTCMKQKIAKFEDF